MDDDKTPDCAEAEIYFDAVLTKEKQRLTEDS